MPNKAFKIYYLSETAVTVEFGQQIAEELLNAVNSLNLLLHQQPFPGFNTTVPAYSTLTVFYDPVIVIKSDLPGAGCFAKVSGYLDDLKFQKKTAKPAGGDTITIPVCYGGGFGPDLEEVADSHHIGIAEVIKLHSAATYKVYMIGFVPGFAYLGGMDERLATPRKATPRKLVPAGAVGIAGQQTGIYPLDTPGGWQIIGQTPLKMFDRDRGQPSLLKAGDMVVFKAIDIQEFNELLAG
ncbi:5-oxoprolinase subunit PxpB [Mucilaginibacter sp. AW1-7]|jgi:inhibitor of KinA|uniref:5-oxoprolinase subunit PxpB n=1 Tax=Mucilaginibacter sp. AW1-7 TaxID=3349874 RepID=UPI003F732BB7